MICPHFGPCGGCVSQDVPYPVQLERKRGELGALLRDALGSRVPPVEPFRAMPTAPDGMPWRFRHKAAFVFGRASGNPRTLVMGHYAAGSQRIVPVEACPVHSDRANRLAFSLRDHLARARIPAAGPALDGILRHVVIRTTHDDREAVVMLVVARNDKSLRRPLRAFLASPDPPTGLLVNVHDRPGPFMVGEQTIRISGRESVRETRPGATFLVSPTSFFQTNPEAAAMLLDEVLAQARTDPPDEGHASAGGRAADDDRGTVLDLYAGSGLFAIPFALGGRTVVAVEENPQAVRDGEANVRANRVPAGRLRFIRGRVEHALSRIGRTPPALVVLDPPRQGCAPVVLRAVFHDLAPPRAIYVSCDPASLARDLAVIVAAGYRVTRVQPIDMFPHTPHIEAVVTLDRHGQRDNAASTRRRGGGPTSGIQGQQP